MDSIAWLCIAVAITPVLIYLSIKKPFVFPFGAYVFLVPCDDILSLTGASEGPTITRYLGLLTILTLLFKAIRENKLMRPSFTTILWPLFAAYSVLTSLWATNLVSALAIIPTVLSLTVLYLVVSLITVEKDEYESISWLIFLGGFLAALYSMYDFYVLGFTTGDTLRATLFVGDSATDPNQFAFGLLLPLSIGIYMMLKEKSVLKKILFSGGATIIFLGILVSSSRGVMLGTGALLIIYILNSREKLSLTSILAVFVIVLLALAPAFFFERWLFASQTGGAGRVGIWSVGLEAAKKYWALGSGIGNFPDAYTEFARSGLAWLGYSRDHHNIYLGLFVEVGIIGAILMVMAIWKHYMLINANRTSGHSEDFMLKGALLAILIASFFLNTIWRKPFWLIWMLIMIRHNTRESANESDYSVAHVPQEL